MKRKTFQTVLQSIKNQSYKNIEVIVVDNFSVDKTVNLAEKYRVTIYFKGNERSAQRNYGAKVAKGEYLLYLDADMILESTTLIRRLRCKMQKRYMLMRFMFPKE